MWIFFIVPLSLSIQQSLMLCQFFSCSIRVYSVAILNSLNFGIYFRKNILDLQADYKVNADVPVPAQKSTPPAIFFGELGCMSAEHCSFGVGLKFLVVLHLSAL